MYNYGNKQRYYCNIHNDNNTISEYAFILTRELRQMLHKYLMEWNQAPDIVVNEPCENIVNFSENQPKGDPNVTLRTTL